MSGWELTIDAVAAAGGVLVLVVLFWAASERAKAHARWTRLTRQSRQPHGRRVVDWCMAMSATLGAI